MEVHRKPVDADHRQQVLEQGRDFVGGRLADGVADREFDAAKVQERLDHRHDCFRANRSFVGAVEGRGDVAAHGHRRLANDRAEPFDRFGDRRVDVLPVEGVAGRREHGNLVDPCGDRPGQPRFVRHQRHVLDARPAGDPAEHLVRIRQLRDPAWRDEGTDLDLIETRLGQGIDEGDLRVGRDDPLLVLETVSRADLDDPDRLHRAGSRFRALRAAA